MAEGWASQTGERITQGLRNLNPVTRVRNMFSGFRDHPGQTIGTGLLTLLGGALAGPIGAQIGRVGSQYAFNRYNESQAPDALPGITSPNTYGQPSQNIGNLLGIPNYAGSSSPANPYLTGNFGQQPSNQSPGFQPINMDYGQSQPNPQMEGGGLPGITGPNIYSGSPSGPSSNMGNLGSLGGMGRTVGTASLGQVEAMLGAGRGRGERVLFAPHSLNDERAEARAQGMTLQQFRNRA